MPPFDDKRFVVVAACHCNSSHTIFRGHSGILTAEKCLMISHGSKCDYILFDANHKNRVAAFIFVSGARIPHGLEAVGGWPCPVIELAATDVPQLNKRFGQCRFKSLRKRTCPKCIRKAMHDSQWRAARIAFRRWKAKCRFIYN